MIKEDPHEALPVFLLFATITVFSPGPGVVMTLTNAIRCGFRNTFGGILGIAFGAFVVAAISATSIGFILATSALAFTIIKYIGAAYLVYLGVRLWRTPALRIEKKSIHEASFGRRFIEGVSLQLTNPKVIFFYLSIFPQFIDPTMNYSVQFGVLVLTYSSLVVIIHSFYAVTARRAKRWFNSERGGRAINKVGGAVFVFFGAALATAKR